MKSIVQESSTIAKAIEHAWKIAGNPQEFSVKILEMPIYNMFGFTKRSAKIAFLFENDVKREPSQIKGKVAPRVSNTPNQPSSPLQAALQQKNQPRRPAQAATQSTVREAVVSVAQEIKKPSLTPKPAVVRPEGLWNEELAVSARTWLSEVLSLMGMADVTFKTEIQDFNLRVILSRSLVEDPTQDKHMLASLSTLMIATLKRQYRKALRGHKIILSH